MFVLPVRPGADRPNDGVHGDRKGNVFFVHNRLGLEPPDWNRVEAKKSAGREVQFRV